MENFDQLFTLIAQEESISLNTDILETGLINILILLGILLFTGGSALRSLMEERRLTITGNVEDAEDRLKEAEFRLSEAQKQLSQVDVVIKQIKSQTISSKKFLLKSELEQVQEDLQLRFERVFAAVQSNERQIFLEIKQRIITLVLQQTLVRAKQTFGTEERATALINKTISKLEGDLL